MAKKYVDVSLAPLFLNENGCKMIKQMPAADVQEVIKCKDCKHCLKDFTWREAHLCMISSFARSVKLDDYCSYGAVKDGGNNDSR